MTENRSLKRWHLIYYLRVFDLDEDSLLGHLVDITTKGMKMVSEKPTPIGKEFHLKMEVPLKTCAAEKVKLNAHSLWCSKDANPDFYATGFRLVNPEKALIGIIRALIDELSFND